MPHIRGDPRAGHPTEEERRIMEARAGQVPARPGTQAPSSSDPWGLLGLQIAADNPFLEFMRTPIGALGIRPEQYLDPMLTAMRYLARATETVGLPISSVIPMTGALGPRSMIEAPGEQIEAFKAFLEPAMRGDWDAAMHAYQDEITPTLPWQDPDSKIPFYHGLSQIPAAFVPTGGPFLAGSKVVSSAPSIARAAAKLAPAAARPGVYRGVRKTAEPVGKAMMAPWQLENLAGQMALRGAVKGVKGVGRGAGWLGGRARRGAAEAAVRVPGGGELGLKIAGVQPVAGGSGTPFYREVREKVIEKFTDPNLQTQFLDMQKQFTDMGLGFDAVSVGQRGDEFFLSVSRPRIKAKINEVIDKTSNDPGIGEGVRHWIRTSEPYFGVEKKKSFRSNNLYFNNFDDLRNWLRKGEYKSPEILGTTLRPGEVVEPLYELGKATQRRPSWILPPISKRKQKFTEERMRKLEKDIEEYNLQQEGLGVEPVGATPRLLDQFIRRLPDDLDPGLAAKEQWLHTPEGQNYIDLTNYKNEQFMGEIDHLRLYDPTTHTEFARLGRTFRNQGATPAEIKKNNLDEVKGLKNDIRSDYQAEMREFVDNFPDEFMDKNGRAPTKDEVKLAKADFKKGQLQKQTAEINLAVENLKKEQTAQVLPERDMSADFETWKASRAGVTPTVVPTAAPIARAIAKEPWQMTKAEFGIGEAPIVHEGPTSSIKKRFGKRGPTPKQLKEFNAEKYARTRGLKAYRAYVEKSNEHISAVRKAVSEGKPVPDEVLREYPGIQRPTGITEAPPTAAPVHPFQELANAQRGAPEALGTSSVPRVGLGIRQYMSEHIGDIINRMTDKIDSPAGIGVTREQVVAKVARAIKTITDRYGMRKEIDEQIRSNSKRHGISFDEAKKQIDDHGKKYADAYRELPTYNQAHRDAQEAAVAWGEQRYEDALVALKRIADKTHDEEIWKNYILEGYDDVVPTSTEMVGDVTDEDLTLGITSELIAEGKLYVSKLLDKLKNYKRPNIGLVNKELDKLEARGKNVKNIRDLIEDYKDINREDFEGAGSALEYSSEREDAWNAVLKAIENLEVESVVPTSTARTPIDVATKTGPDVREVNLGKRSEEEAQDLVDRYATWENLVDDFKKASSEKVNPDKASPTGIGAGDPPSVGTGGIRGEGLPVNSSGNNTLPPSPTLGFLIENMFREDVWRRIANLPIMKQFLQNSPWFSNPAGVANSPADKFLVLRSTYRYYADQKAELLIARVKQLGSEESIWGKMDDTGKLTEGPFEGMFLNDIRTQRYKFENRMTPEMKTWINAMEELEAAKLQYLKDNNIPIHELKFEEGGVYAGRRVVGKIGRDGKVKDTAIIGKRPGAKLPSERQRWYTTQAEAVEKGFRYMSETDALYLNIKGAYRRVDDQNLVEWFLNQPGISYRHISTSFGVPELNIAYKAEVRRLNAAEGGVYEGRRVVGLKEQIKHAIGGERITGHQIRGIKKYFPEEAERLKQLSADIQAGKETAPEVKSLEADVELLIENRKAVAKDAEVKLLEAKGKAAKVKQGEYTVSAPAFNDIIFTGDDAFNLSSALNKQFAGDYNAVLASVNKVNALLRFFQLSGDASPFGIHLIFMAGRPDIYLRSGVAFVKALFDPTFASKQKRNIPQELLDKHPGIQWVSGGGNEITEALGTGGLLMEKPFKLLGAPLQPFARGFESALDTAGIELMKSLDRYATTSQRAYQVDDFINKFRGLARSDRLGVTETNRAIENATFLASSYNRSIAALFFDVFHGGLSGHLARVNLARGVTAVSAMTVVVGYSMGDSTKQVIDRLNPRSPNFMTWNVGGTRIGPGSKVRSVLKLLADTSKDPGSLMEKSMENPGLRFLRGNLAPVASDGLDILVGSTYIGDPIDTPAAFGKEILAPALMPIWVQSTVLEGGTFGERLTRGGVEFLGGRAYPASPLRETARKKYGMDYNDLEYYQKDEVREDEEVQEYFREQENKTGVKNRYFSHLNAYDAEHIAKMNSYVSDYRGDKNAIRNAYYSNLQFYRGAKDAVKRALEPGFKEPDIDDKDLGERALAERFELFDNPRIKSSTGNIIWDNYDAALSRLEAKWARQTRIDPQTGQRESVLYYVRRNTNLTPVPSGLLPYLAESTRTNIYRSKAARIKHQRDIAPAPQPVKETDRRVTFPFGKDLEPMESYITFTFPPRGTVPVGR